MTLTERHWWAILVDAEALSEGKESLDAHRLACLARVKLRDEFGVNLDTIWTEARPEFLWMLEELRDK